MSKALLSRALMYAGLLPFIAGAAASLFKLDSWWLITDIPTSLALYALAIASFMSGIHWGIAQTQKGHSHLLLMSNLMVLLPWIMFVFNGAGALFYLALAYVFFKQYWVDRSLAGDALFSASYMQDRTIVAFTVVAAMLLLTVEFALKG